MQYNGTLIAVRDMDRSLAFYKDLFGQSVAMDLGWCKTLTCGLVLQLHFDRIAGFPEANMRFGNYNGELYFETDDMDGFMALLEAHPEVRRLHDLQTFPWHQRGIRIFDPDEHLIEISETMQSVGMREFEKGLSAEETAKVTEHPIDLVRRWYALWQEQKHSRTE